MNNINLLGSFWPRVGKCSFFLFQPSILTIVACQSQGFQSKDKKSLIMSDNKLNALVTYQSILLNHGSTCSFCFVQDLFGSSPHMIPHRTCKQSKFLKLAVVLSAVV